MFKILSLMWVAILGIVAFIEIFNGSEVLDRVVAFIETIMLVIIFLTLLGI